MAVVITVAVLMLSPNVSHAEAARPTSPSVYVDVNVSEDLEPLIRRARFATTLNQLDGVVLYLTPVGLSTFGSEFRSLSEETFSWQVGMWIVGHNSWKGDRSITSVATEIAFHGVIEDPVASIQYRYRDLRFSERLVFGR